MTRNINLRGIKCASNYLVKRGYEILDTEPSEHIDIVAKHDDSYVFLIVRVRTDEFPRCEANREAMESGACKWLTENDKGNDMEVRFDVIDIVVIKSDRALIRHHIKAFQENQDEGLLKELLESGDITEKAYKMLGGE